MARMIYRTAGNAENPSRLPRRLPRSQRQRGLAHRPRRQGLRFGHIVFRGSLGQGLIADQDALTGVVAQVVDQVRLGGVENITFSTSQ